MEQRRETKLNKIPWFHLHWPRRSDIFENDKVVYPQMCNIPSFALCDKQYFYNMSASVISHKKGDKKKLIAILGILNSEYMKYYLNIFGKKRGVNLDLTISFISDVPIPPLLTDYKVDELSQKYYNSIVNLSFLLNAIYKQNIESEKINFIEELLNTFIYNLYLNIKPLSYFSNLFSTQQISNFSYDNIDSLFFEYFNRKDEEHMSTIIKEISFNSKVLEIKNQLT
jgi:hypothetical protein